MPYENIPFGRGLRRGPDAFQGQLESLKLREQLSVKDRGRVLSPASSPLHAWSTGASAAGLSVDTIYMIPLGYVGDRLTLSEARARCTVASAGSTLRTSLYLQQSKSRHKATRIAGSDVTFDTSGTGLLTDSSVINIRIRSESLVYMASYYSTGVATMLTAESGAAPLIPILSYAATSFPAELSIADMTKSTVVRVPYVDYLSPEMAEVFQ